MAHRELDSQVLNAEDVKLLATRKLKRQMMKSSPNDFIEYVYFLLHQLESSSVLQLDVRLDKVEHSWKEHCELKGRRKDDNKSKK